MTTARTGQQDFPHTRWSLVVEATQGASSKSAAALELICRTYWYPLYAYVRRSGQSPHDAEDLTQEFFHRLLDKRWLTDANQEKGKLRTFLITALKNFMANEWRRASSQRRGGNRTHIPIDTVFAESRYAADPTAPLPADHLYERQWALTLLDLTLERLKREFVTAGKPGNFEALKECLMAARGEMDYKAMAARLGSSEGATRVAVHRLRKRFREIYREEVLLTLPEGTDLNSELRCLAEALSSQKS